MLPMDPARLAGLIGPDAGRVRMDALNYRSQVQRLFRQHGWDDALTDAFAATTRTRLTSC